MASVIWQSSRPNANGHYWRIWSHGHVEILPITWKLGDPNPPDSKWPTDTPENRAKGWVIENDFFPRKKSS